MLFLFPNTATTGGAGLGAVFFVTGSIRIYFTLYEQTLSLRVFAILGAFSALNSVTLVENSPLEGRKSAFFTRSFATLKFVKAQKVLKISKRGRNRGVRPSGGQTCVRRILTEKIIESDYLCRLSDNSSVW